MTEPNMSNGAAAWTVVAQTEKTILGPTGQATEVMAVTFQLQDGTQATVNVPIASYTPANVRTAIATKAAAVHAVNNLSG